MGKISNHQTSFNDASWGGSTCAYVQGIKTNLSNKNFDISIDRAMEFARKSQRATGASTKSKTETSAGDAMEIDKHELMKDRLCSDVSDKEYDGADEGDDWCFRWVIILLHSSAPSLT